MRRLNSEYPIEFFLLSWGLLLNAVWEFSHSALYTDHALGWRHVIWTRLHCTVGDVLILVVCFWVTSLLFRSRIWSLRSNALFPCVVFVALGLSYTLYSEWLNTRVRQSWTYTSNMPTLFGIGLSPMLQWLVIPPVLVQIVRFMKMKPPQQ